jgi:hypothetical protein
LQRRCGFDEGEVAGHGLCQKLSVVRKRKCRAGYYVAHISC